MRLRADIQREGVTKHLAWDITAGAGVPVAPPVTVEIAEEREGAFLLRLNERGDCVADTWHENVAAAKAQAAFEYGIADEDWTPVP